MNWKTNLQLLDLSDNDRLEVTCTKCGHSRYENKYLLIKKYGLDFQYIDEVEHMLSCNNRGCHGAVRISLSTEDDTEGFVGGLA